MNSTEGDGKAVDAMQFHHAKRRAAHSPDWTPSKAWQIGLSSSRWVGARILRDWWGLDTTSFPCQVQAFVTKYKSVAHSLSPTLHYLLPAKQSPIPSDSSPLHTHIHHNGLPPLYVYLFVYTRGDELSPHADAGRTMHFARVWKLWHHNKDTLLIFHLCRPPPRQALCHRSRHGLQPRCLPRCPRPRLR